MEKVKSHMKPKLALDQSYSLVRSHMLEIGLTNILSGINLTPGQFVTL